MQADRELSTPGEFEVEMKKLVNTSKAKLKEMEDHYERKLEEQGMRFSQDTERLLKQQDEKYQKQLTLQEKKNEAQLEEMMRRLRLSSVLPGGQLDEDPRRLDPNQGGFGSDLDEDGEVLWNIGDRRYQEGPGGAKSNLPGGQGAAGGRPKMQTEAPIPGLLTLKPDLGYSTPKNSQTDGASGGQKYPEPLGGGSRSETPPPHSGVRFLPRGRGKESGGSYSPYEPQQAQYSPEDMVLLRKMEQQGHDDRVMLDRLEAAWRARKRRVNTGGGDVGVRGPPEGDRSRRDKNSQDYQDSLEINLMRNINHFKEFSGTKSQEFSSWLDDWKIWCGMNRLRELNDIHMQKTLFLSRLSGDARVRVSNLYSPETQQFQSCRTLDELMRGVKGIFCHLSDSGYLINVFETLQQSGADIQDYFSKKYRAFNEAYGSSHSPMAVFRESFIRGLDRSPLQEKLLEDPAETPEQLREAVVKLSGQIATAQRLGLTSEGACNRVGRGYQGPARGDLKCNHCQRSGHTEDSCWTKNPGLMPDWTESGQSPPSRAAPSLRATPGGCWSCGLLGHLAANCPKPGPVSGASASQPPPAPTAAAAPESGSMVTIHDELKTFLLSAGSSRNFPRQK